MAELTLAAVAMLDPAIKLGRQAWKTYKLQASFGEDFRDFSDSLMAERQLLEELLKTPLASLQDEYFDQLSSIENGEALRSIRENDEENNFEAAKVVLNTLASLSAQFEICHDLIRKYTPPATDNRSPSPGAAPTVTIHPPEDAITLTETSSSTPFPKSPRQSGSEDRDPSRASNSSSPRPPTTDLSDNTKKRRRSVMKPIKEFFASHKRSGSGSSQQSSGAISDTSSVEPPAVQSALGERVDEALNGELVRREKENRALQAKSTQDDTNAWSRTVVWVPQDRHKIEEALDKIQKLNRRLEDLLVIRYIGHQPEHEEHLPSASGSTVLSRDDVTPHLKALETIIYTIPGSRNITMHLKLLDNYKEYSISMQAAVEDLGLTEGGYVFPVEAISSKPSSNSVEQTSANGGHPRVVNGAQAPQAVDRPKRAPTARSGALPATSSLTKQYSTNHELLMEISRQSSQPAPPTQIEWPEFGGQPDALELDGPYFKERTSLHTSHFICRIFEHQPGGQAQVRSLRDFLPDRRLTEPELLGFRAHLACAIAGFFHGAFSADTPLNSKDLIYVIPESAQTQDMQSLARELTKPYLRDLKSGRYFNNDERRMHAFGSEDKVEAIHKLGVILYEIGTWQPVSPPGESPPTVPQAIEIAKANAMETQKLLGQSYYKALWKCLNWETRFGVAGFLKDVVEPLQRLRSGHTLPSNERW